MSGEITKFKIGDKLKVMDLKHLSGRVLRIQIANQGAEYELRYFDGIEPRTAWLFEDELEVQK